MKPSPDPDPAAWSIKKLGEADDYFLSTHALWQEYCGEPGDRNPTYEHFEQMLRSDKRFYVTPGVSPPMPSPHQEVLGSMGFPSRALVALAAKRPTREALDAAIRAKAAQLQYALRKAWEARPADDPQVEERLLFLMEQAEKLCEMLESEQCESGQGEEK